MPYPIEYWQALLDRTNETIQSNRKPSPNSSYFQYTTGQTGRAIYAAFNGDSNAFHIPLNQNVNLHFHNWADQEEPLRGVREALRDLPEGTLYFTERLNNTNGGFKYWLVRPMEFNMNYTGWLELRPDEREDLLNWHNDMVNRLYRLVRR